MDRSDLLFVSLGGGANRLIDTLANTDPRFIPLFINTSITDLQSLDNFNELTKNYLCISTQNGVGRNREIGKQYAEQWGYTILDTILKHQQEVIYLVASFGGGSGSSILSTILKAIDSLKEDGDFNKIINIIGILPDLNSPNVILSNAIDTWNEVMSYSKCINSMMFIDNNTKLFNTQGNEKEVNINEHFCNLFDSVFSIPDVNGINFDSGNLGNILTDKGYMTIYDLDQECSSIEVAYAKAKKESVLASMFMNESSFVTTENGELIKCGYWGLSAVTDRYMNNFISSKYKPRRESYIGKNEEKNLLLISGLLPPFDTITLMEHELASRKDKEKIEEIDFSQFAITKSKDKTETNNNFNNKERTSSSNGMKKMKMKKNLFKR